MEYILQIAQQATEPIVSAIQAANLALIIGYILAFTASCVISLYVLVKY